MVERPPYVVIGARARSLGPDHFLLPTQGGSRGRGWPGGKDITAGAQGRSEKYVEAGGRFLPHERNIFSSGDPWARRGIYFTRHGGSGQPHKEIAT